ncbi:hypothetical protein EIN_129180 [Entamoeba invadens IP1]|uniref:Uncharacterized protein n=1 Tax=Entamoeba invadens IP1 TaxID=370355 RepID=L7FMD4_ENTIV|nr:hypothetical protein EIN_129180 [Entamoeba invadens IP1]ELP91578.1 hypothetical protein EIN_129180 [Entamoeba invadens IP1]|eukprot:XP_004258349.1 hypothetical protein EIN_129180 [Entamoeba invadens IP1]
MTIVENPINRQRPIVVTNPEIIDIDYDEVPELPLAEQKVVDLIPQVKEQQKFKIGIWPVVNTKVRGTMKHNNIAFEVVSYEARNKYERYPRYGYYISNFNFNIRNDTTKEYTMEQYTEDIAMSHEYYEISAGELPTKYDYIFIPPVGVTLNDKIAEKLYTFLNAATQTNTEACVYQTYMSEEERIKNRVYHKYRGYMPNFPKRTHKSISGLLFKGSMLELLEEYGKVLYFISRFDTNIQHYCEIADKEIFVAPENIYELPTHNFFN